jgi:hypothetical protein
MAELVLRSTKAAPLTNSEIDSNFEELETRIQNLDTEKEDKTVVSGKAIAMAIALG